MHADFLYSGVSVIDIHFNVNKDFYNTFLLDEDEIKVLKATKGPKLTIVDPSPGNNGNSCDRTVEVSPSHFGGADTKVTNEDEEVVDV